MSDVTRYYFSVGVDRPEMTAMVPATDYDALLAERDRLATENERLARDAKNDAIAYKAVIERQEELRAEIEALKKDAERYRWLRSVGQQQLNAAMHSGRQELDRFVDHALQGEQQ